MTDKLVPTVRTPVTLAMYVRAVVRAWHVVAGGLPKKESIGVLWSQYMIETGGADSWNWNIGNSKEVPNDGIDYQQLRGVWEGVSKAEADRLIASGQATLDTSAAHIAAVAPRVSVVFQPPHPATWFSAFPDLDHAMEYHLKLLAKRFAPAWPAVVAGSVADFAKLLSANHYFTASAQAYAAGMAPAFATYMKSNAYEEAIADLAAPLAETAPLSPSASQPDIAAPDTSLFVEVTCKGRRWLVAPLYIAPVGIGEAEKLAAALGFELPSPDLVDAIYAAADLKIDGSLMTFGEREGNDWTPATMNSPETHALMAAKLAKLIGDRGLGRDFHLLAGPYKDVVVWKGGLGLYGMQRADGTPIQGRDQNGAPYTKHDKAWKDYAQGARLVRPLD